MKLNPSFKHHVLIGIITSLWVFLFLFLTRPFKQYNLTLSHLFIIALGMGLIIFMCYLISIMLQSKIYNHYQKWSVQFESVILIFFSLLLLTFSYSFYKSDYAKGNYSFFKYVGLDFIPALVIILPLLIFSRRFIIRYVPIISNKKTRQPVVVIQGENKLDYLKIKQSDLVCASIFQNYTRVYYLRDDNLESKLMRIPLKKMAALCPFLLKVHRSHLINPEKYMGFKDKKTVQLSCIDVPFSKTYINSLLNL